MSRFLWFSVYNLVHLTLITMSFEWIAARKAAGKFVELNIA